MVSLALVRGLSNCTKVFQFDGPQPALSPQRRSSYVEFKQRVRQLGATDEAFAHSHVYESEQFLFAAHNLAAAVRRVNTTFLLSLQHDYQLVRVFDAPGLLHSMLAIPAIKHVRLNMRPNAPARGFDGLIANASFPGLTVPLTRTCGWSDSPHIALTAYYRDFIIPRNLGDHGGGKRKFMEESIHYPMQRNFQPGGCWEAKQQAKQGATVRWPDDFDNYGTYLYGYALPTDGSYTRHRSLRGNVPQWGFEHDPKGDMRRSHGHAGAKKAHGRPGGKGKAAGGGVPRGGNGGRGRGRQRKLSNRAVAMGRAVSVGEQKQRRE